MLAGGGAHRYGPTAEHGHGSIVEAEPADLRVQLRTRIVITGCLLTVGVATMFGLVTLWPSGGDVAASDGVDFAIPGATFPEGSVSSVTPFPCPPDSVAGTETSTQPGAARGTAGSSATCAHLQVLVQSGQSQGRTVKVDATPVIYASGIHPGDGIQLLRLPATNGGSVTYSFFDFDRKLPLAALALIFAIVVITVARLRGVLALVGIGVAMFVLLEFMLPALLEGTSAFAVALVGSSAIMYVVLYLAHGLSMRTSTALIGTLLGVLITAAIGTEAVKLTQLTGLSSDDTGVLSAVAANVSLQGLLTCGVIVAGLGILNDVTITQASAVWELRAADPNMRRSALFITAMRIGRDHIASSVYTIVFAYAGAALPVLLLIQIYQRGLIEALVNETIAEEVVRTLASGIGLVLAVPITTSIAVLAASPAVPSGPKPGAILP
jgi:uncharacterized membrane protein